MGPYLRIHIYRRLLGYALGTFGAVKWAKAICPSPGGNTGRGVANSAVFHIPVRVIAATHDIEGNGLCGLALTALLVLNIHVPLFTRERVKQSSTRQEISRTALAPSP